MSIRHIPVLARAAFAGLLATAWLAVTLAGLGRFHALPCLLGGLLAAGVVAWRYRGSGRALEAADLWAAAAALTAFLLAWPPDEMILGGWDPGVYLHTAAAVAREGTLLLHLPDIAGFDAVEKSVLARDLWGVVEPYGGMRMLTDGRLSPGFFHLYPCLMAVAWSLGGLRAALLVNPVLGVGAVLAFYALARRFLAPRGAAVGAWLLALNVGQLWQMGFPTAEMLTQVLLLGGAALLADALREGQRLDGLLAGAAAGLALLCRYDTIMFLVPLLALLALGWPYLREWSSAEWRRACRHPEGDRSVAPPSSLRALWPAGLALGVLTVQAVLHQRWIAPYYHPVSGLVGRAGLLVGGLFVVTMCALDAPRLELRRRLQRFGPVLRVLAAAGLAVFVLAAWFVRPRLADWAPPVGGPEARNMGHLAALFGPVGLAVAWGGVAWLLAARREAWQRAWLLAGCGVAALLVINIYNDQFLMWLARRFIPVVIPLLALGQAAALCGLASRVPARFGRWVAVTGLAVLVALQGPALRVTMTARDWPGLAVWFNRLVPALPPGQLVFTDQPGFAAPLRFLYDVPAYELHARGPDRRERLAEILRRRVAAGGTVWLLSMSEPLVAEGLRVEARGEYPLQTWQQQTGRWTVPRGVKFRGGDFKLYRVEAAPESNRKS